MHEEMLLEIRNKRVLVIGDVMLDVYCHGDVNRLNPEEHAAPLLDLTSREYRAGGAANVAMNARELGARVTLWGVVGDDPAGDVLTGILKEKGINFEGRWGINNPRTIEKMRMVAAGRQIMRCDSEERSPERYRMDLQKALPTLVERIRESDVVIVSDYAKGVVERTLLREVSALARGKGILVVLDPKPKNKLSFTGLVDVITPNRKEALELAGMEMGSGAFPMEQVCRRIHDKYDLEHLVITMSEAGYLLSRKNGAWHQVPTRAQRIFDVTGAGDTFVAALACALAAGAGMEEAAELANLAAGVVVGKLGTATASPEEVAAQAKLALPENWQA